MLLRLLNGLVLFFFFLSFSTKAEETDALGFQYVTDDLHELSPGDVLDLFQNGRLTKSSNILNLSYANKTAWIVIKISSLEEEKVLTIQNAHIDTLDLYFYSGSTLISHKKSGDHLPFNTRDLENNFFNFIVPESTGLIVLKVSTEGPLFVPLKIVDFKQAYSFLNTHNILHWIFFGFLILMLVTNIVIYLWVKASIYLYYILVLISLFFLTGVDYGYTFQYLWPDFPEINRFNTLFYLSSIFIILFSVKFLKVKKNFPRVYKIFIGLYFSYLIIAVVNVFVSYRISIQLYAYTIVIFNLIYLFLVLYFFKKSKSPVEKLFVTGWTIFIAGNLIYVAYLLFSDSFSIVLNNLPQIAAAVQIIFINLAILSKIEVLSKEKASLLTEHNMLLEQQIKTQDELIDTILDREKVIAQERTRIASILDTTKGLIIILDRSGRVLSFNKACEDCTGYNFEEVKDRFLWDFLIPENEIDKVKMTFESLSKGLVKTIQDENSWKTKDGRNRWIVWDSSAVYDESGKVEYILGTGIDITEKRNLEIEREKSEITLQSILNSVNQSVQIVNKDLKLVMYNEKFKDRMEKFWNIKVFPGKKVGSGLSQYEKEFWMAYFYRALSGETISFTRSLEYGIYEYAFYPIKVENEVIGVFVLTSDITERIRREEEQGALIKYQEELIDKIKEQEASLSALINSSPDLIFSVDQNLNLTEFNRSLINIIEKQHKVALKKGMNFRPFISPDTIEQSEISFKKALSGRAVNEIVEFVNEGTRKFMNVIFSPILSVSNEVIGVTVVSRDITENKKAQEQLIEINKQVSEYRLMALRSAMNPHFLFNSLNSIQYFVAKNERKLALHYLSLFASLIRKILDSTLSPKVSLGTELEILNHYIALEKLRFENKFSSEVRIQPDIDVNSVFIPSLLIQPFVENSILHGLTNKQGQGILEIVISFKDDFLLVSVRDNGIGRKEARLRNGVRKNKSYGLLLTKERLDIINKTANVSFSVEDLVSPEGEPMGTKTDILIKV